MTTTRRGFLAGAIAGGAVPASVARAAAPAAGPLQARQEIVRRGRAIAVAPDGRRLVVAHDQRRTIAISVPGRDGVRLVDVGGQPLAVAVSPDGRLAAVTTAFWDEPGLALVALGSGELLARVAVGPAPCDVAFAAGGERVVVSGGEQEGTVHVLDAQDFRVVARRHLGSVPRGVCAEPGGRAAWIALCGLDRMVRVDARDGRIRRELRTPPLPERVAVSPDGRRLLVSHAGTEGERVSDIDIASGGVTRRRAGRLPSAVAWTLRGRRLVALGGAGEIVAFGRAGARTIHAVGGAPRGLAVAGRRAWTVDALGGAVNQVRL